MPYLSSADLDCILLCDEAGLLKAPLYMATNSMASRLQIGSHLRLIFPPENSARVEKFIAEVYRDCTVQGREFSLAQAGEIVQLTGHCLDNSDLLVHIVIVRDTNQVFQAITKINHELSHYLRTAHKEINLLQHQVVSADSEASARHAALQEELDALQHQLSSLCNELDRSNEDQRRRVVELDTLVSAMTILYKPAPITVLLTQILELSLQVMPRATFGVIYLLDPTAQYLRALTTVGGTAKDINFPPREELLVRALANTCPLIENRFEPSDATGMAIGPEGRANQRSLLVCPFILTDSTPGCTIITSDQPSSFQINHLQLSASLCATARVALENALARGEVPFHGSHASSKG